MLGGLGLTATGFYLAVRRVGNDLVVMARFVAKRGNPEPLADAKADPLDA